MSYPERAALTLTLFLLSAVLLDGCAHHSESSSTLQASGTATLDATRKVDTTEPVAVPERLEFRGWTMPNPADSIVVPAYGGGALLHLPSTVKPLRAALVPDDWVDGRVAAASCFEGTLYFGKPGEKTTHVDEGSHGAASGAVNASAATEKDSKPFGVFAFLAAFWPYLAAAVPILAFVFRKQLLGLLVRLGLKGAA